MFTPAARDLLLVNFYNHLSNAERIATEAAVAWAGPRPMETAIQELRRRGAAGERVAVIGPLGHRPYAALAEFAEPVPLDAAYTRLRLVKSDEELDWVRRGAAMTDAGLRALAEHAVPGVDERRLGDIVERAYVADGGTTHIHYFAATPMDEPRLAVPAQWPSTRPLERGDALVCELSAAYWDYAGQVLRTFSVGAEPTPLYRELHAVADAALDAILSRVRAGATAADLVAASGVIEDAGYTTRDDLVHGFVGGYFPPVLGSASRALEPIPEFTLEAGMTLVVQPNVVTRDEHAGVQTGELVAVTADGFERLHHVESGLLRI